MSWKKAITIVAVSALLSAISCIIYAKIYAETLLVDFSEVAGTTNFIISSTIGCLLMTIGYKLAIKWKGVKTMKWMNILYGILSFASIASVFNFNLPLDIEYPEMFPGFVIPMHFFPLLSFLIVLPFFNMENKSEIG